MTAWNPELYLQFGDERTRPAIDLAAHIPLTNPKRIVDLGCGPGNSTAILKKRWPHTEVTGVDNSPEMIAAAIKAEPTGKWILGDATTWTATESIDVVYSNAALQWVPDHAAVIPHLFRQVAPGGVLAFQIPAHLESPLHRLIETIADRPDWKGNPAAAKQALTVERPEIYYDLLAPSASGIDIWVTEYHHVLPDPAAILTWIRGTGLRPFLTACVDDAERAEFERLLLEGLSTAYPRRVDGRVLFPFRRLFVVATLLP